MEIAVLEPRSGPDYVPIKRCLLVLKMPRALSWAQWWPFRLAGWPHILVGPGVQQICLCTPCARPALVVWLTGESLRSKLG